MLKNVLVIVLAVAPSLAFAKEPIVGFLMTDGERRFAEERESNPYAARVLRKNGFRFGLTEWRMFFGERADEARTLELLRQFNVMVLDTPFDFSIMDLGPDKQRTAAAARGALEKYLREGGGVLLILQAVRYPGDKDQDYANLILKGLGLEMLHEGVFDNARRFAAPIASIFAPEEFFWTKNIAKGHPATEGVGRVCLPQYHNGKTPGVVAVRFSPDWQVLVRGEQSAQSYLVTPDQTTDYGHVGTFPGAPPIVAVRSYGKGRVMAISVPARSVHLNYGVPGCNMIVESAGDRADNRPSDGGRLALNGLRWLAEASRDNPGLGGFRDEAPGAVQFPESIAWDDVQFPKPVRGVRGILGARTALSDGKGTVAQYVVDLPQPAAEEGASGEYVVVLPCSALRLRSRQAR